MNPGILTSGYQPPPLPYGLLGRQAPVPMPGNYLHPETQDWASRVRTAGGSVSATTLNAVDRFVKAIYAAVMRDRFHRLNLFCGNSDASLIAVRTPLFRGQSMTGTQFGGVLDGNVNFVSGDYVETGPTGGLAGNGSSKFLFPGVATNLAPEGNRHLCVYECAKATGQFHASIGSDRGSGSNSYWLRIETPVSVYGFCFGATFGGVFPTNYTGGSMWLGVNDGPGAGVLYQNRNLIGSAVTAIATPDSTQMYVFCLSRSGGAVNYSNARLGGYSTGLALTAAQALAYYNAMQEFQSAMRRQV